ncbi:MAG TPA: hypothetical protein VF339_19100 [Gammaproteobacteria bacterium]
MRQGWAALVAAAIGGVFAGVAQAQSGRTLMIDVADCVEIESPSERFRCYESRVDAALGRDDGRAAHSVTQAAEDGADESARRFAATPSGGVIAEHDLEAPPAAGASDFGFRRSDEDARERRRDRDREELFGTVASVQETVPNSYIVTLENGQVWRQVRPKFYPLRPGHRVRIYPTNWGDSYRMSAEELNGFIQVERIR